MTQIDWSKAPEGTTGAMVANFIGETVGFGDVEFLGHADADPRSVYCERPDAWVYHERPSDPEPAAWNGEGLPPVGIYCELGSAQKFTEGNRLEKFPEGTKVLVGGHANFGGRDVAVVIIDGTHFTGTTIPELLRPIRTPEQIAAEEKDKAVAEMVDALGCDPEASKTAEFIRCGLLYDAGYRKQVAP